MLRCLEKDPAQRYPSIEAVYEALNEAIGTPSVALDSAELSGVAHTSPEAERVPTGVGGMSHAFRKTRLMLRKTSFLRQKPKRGAAP